MDFFTYIIQERAQIISLLVEHINLTLISVLVAILIGVPMGILISHFKKINKTVMGIANTIQAIPSMALLGFLIPFLGIGVMPSIFMVVLYSLLPIIKNTYTSIEGINPQMIEAAEGIGLTKLQILFKIQIPMALPVIMAGVRISAVTAVGLMTIAAFVGAGGLGFLVFSGIRTANTYQILAAAIIEKIVVPKGIVSGEEENKKIPFLHKLILTLAVFLILFSSGKNIVKNFIAPQEKVVTIASKDYTEQILLGNMLADLIEDKTDIKVNRKLALGGTQVIFGALNKGEVDMYMEYTGTMFADMLKHNPIAENVKSSDVYSISKKEIEEKYDVLVGKEISANNTYRLAVRKETADKYNLENISDLIKVAIKEAQEETGIKHVKPIIDDICSIDILPVNAHIKRGKYVASHLHLSVAYLLEADENEKLVVKVDENSDVKWIDIDKIFEVINEEHMKDIYKKLIEKSKMY